MIINMKGSEFKRVARFLYRGTKNAQRVELEFAEIRLMPEKLQFRAANGTVQGIGLVSLALPLLEQTLLGLRNMKAKSVVITKTKNRGPVMFIDENTPGLFVLQMPCV